MLFWTTISITNSDIVFGSYDFPTKAFVAGGSPTTAVQVIGSKIADGDGTVHTTFGRIFNVTSANVTQSATAGLREPLFSAQSYRSSG